MGFCFWLRLSRLLFKTRSLALVPFFSPHLANLFILFSPHLVYIYLASLSPLCPTSSSLTFSSKKYHTYILLTSSQQRDLCIARLSFVQSRAISLPPAIVHTSRRHLRLEISTTLRLSSPACATQSSHFTELPSIYLGNRAHSLDRLKDEQIADDHTR